MTVLFLTKMIDYFVERVNDLKKEFPNDLFVIAKDREDAQRYIGEADVVVAGGLSPEQVINARNLKFVLVPWAGVNGLPIDLLAERGVIVANNHGNGKIVAERALGLALALMGRIVEYHNDLSKGIWHGYESGSKPEDFWFSLQGKRVTILGLGTIGRHLAKLLSGFECEIMGFKKTVEPVDGVNYVTNNLEEAINFGKIIFIALPLTKETYHLINKELILQMQGKFLINVGRGQIIEEEALYYGLKNGILAGAAVDTWYLYPDADHSVQLPSRYPIHTFKNVVISPHVGGFTIEGQIGRIDETIENLRRILAGGMPKNIVDLKNEY
ncbi:Phosphoglycerate dehydrogenase [Fervidobacterium changbaicum]|uniref:2-hydroxyacid dehydrogenase n=2 Tax=Fervidobacterium TaxID=2422 RepID=A0AAI8CL18_FERIS|nr:MULTISPECIES: 2-hydroxyacid dehydrogenase [Fervidobacterium]AMW32528.1 2-hydroxyacid dehydrogenase [Fervidobacterium islandicum]QAV32628.1 hydroxyacid dehydrogenase [Fervidobacterium changbaicum]SDH35421.1 Phosphoglycerate dehydrogenase [Fervidobacterium changbaicum]